MLEVLLSAGLLLAPALSRSAAGPAALVAAPRRSTPRQLQGAEPAAAGTAAAGTASNHSHNKQASTTPPRTDSDSRLRDKWTLQRDAQFPSFWFGCNESGPDGPHLARNNITRYSAAWFGWQSLNGVGGCAHEEAN